MEITVGNKYFIESEEQEVTVLETQPARATVLSQVDDSYEYLVQVTKHPYDPADPYTTKWVFQDEFIQDVRGDELDPFIF